MQVVGTKVGHGFEDSQPLFRDVDFTINEGDLLAVTGPSGSGKSTFLSLLAGWMEPRQGTITNSATRTQWVFQNPYGSANRTTSDHVRLAYLAAGRSAKESTQLADIDLERVGLASRARVAYRNLSGGEAQRLMMARALATQPDLLLMDEPTAQLDPHNAAMVIEKLRVLAGSGRAVVIATHDQRVRDACFTELRLGGGG